MPCPGSDPSDRELLIVSVLAVLLGLAAMWWGLYEMRLK